MAILSLRREKKQWSAGRQGSGRDRSGAGASEGPVLANELREACTRVLKPNWKGEGHLFRSAVALKSQLFKTSEKICLIE